MAVSSFVHVHSNVPTEARSATHSIFQAVELLLISMNKTKILFGQLNCSVKLANVSTRCSSHPQGKNTYQYILTVWLSIKFIDSYKLLLTLIITNILCCMCWISAHFHGSYRDTGPSHAYYIVSIPIHPRFK